MDTCSNCRGQACPCGLSLLRRVCHTKQMELPFCGTQAPDREAMTMSASAPPYTRGSKMNELYDHLGPQNLTKPHPPTCSQGRESRVELRLPGPAPPPWARSLPRTHSHPALTSPRGAFPHAQAKGENGSRPFRKPRERDREK